MYLKDGATAVRQVQRCDLLYAAQPMANSDPNNTRPLGSGTPMGPPG